MAIANVVARGFGPSAAIKFVVTRGYSIGAFVPPVIVGGLIAKAKKPKKQWHALPNGVRVETDPTTFQTLLARYELAHRAEVEAAPVEAGLPEAAEAPQIVSAPVAALPVTDTAKAAPAPSAAAAWPLLDDAVSPQPGLSQEFTGSPVIDVSGVINDRLAQLEHKRILDERTRRLIEEDDQLIIRLLLGG